jgi:hypothetical protein
LRRQTIFFEIHMKVFFKIHFTIIVRSVYAKFSSTVSYPHVFRLNGQAHFSSSPCELHVLSSHILQFNHPGKIWWREQLKNPDILHFSLSLCFPCSLSPTLFPVIYSQRKCKCISTSHKNMTTLWQNTFNDSIPFSWCCQLQHVSSINKEVTTKSPLILRILYTLPIKYSQFCYYACFVNANWLQRDWWIGENCLCNTNIRIRVLAVRLFQRPMLIYKVGWQAKFFPIWPYFYYAVFCNATSDKNGELSAQTVTLLTFILELSSSKLRWT